MKVGIIGLGHGAKVLLHAFNQSNIKIHGIVGKNFNKAKKIANLNKINNVYDSWQNLVKDKNIDIVAIAVPAVHQIPMINECIKKNKYILAEKPVGIDFSKDMEDLSYQVLLSLEFLDQMYIMRVLVLILISQKYIKQN